MTGSTDDQAQSGAGVGSREPIGGLPGRRMGRFDAPLCPFQPQKAWLQGTVLTVEFNHKAAECDLLTAARIRMRGRPVPVFNRGWVFDVLYAYQNDKSRPARLVLAGPGWYLLTAKQFRRLAEIIGARRDAGERPVRGIVRRLNSMANEQDDRSQPLDWSFRSDPRGLRQRRSGSNGGED